MGPRLRVLVFMSSLIILQTGGEHLFSNSWAVEVRGGQGAADELAKKHGFVNKGQVRLVVLFVMSIRKLFVFRLEISLLCIILFMYYHLPE